MGFPVELLKAGELFLSALEGFHALGEQVLVEELRDAEGKHPHHGVNVVEEPVDIDLSLFVHDGIIDTSASVMLINGGNYLLGQRLETLEHAGVDVVRIDISHGKLG